MGKMRCLLLACWAMAAGFGGALMLGPRPAAAQPRAVTVFAAASLQDAMKAIGADYGRRTGTKVTFSFAGSSVLAKQIAQGAPADVFVSADPQWMDYLQGRGLLAAGTREDLLTNHLALIAPRDSTVRLRIAPGFPIARALGPDGRLAMADPDAVPAGLYGKAALQALGVWPELRTRIAIGENVRAALVLVARGEAPLGVVYDTDAKADPRVRIVDLFPADSFPPIRYPGAVLKSAASPEAARFLAYLRDPAAQAVFGRLGFTVLKP